MQCSGREATVRTPIAAVSAECWPTNGGSADSVHGDGVDDDESSVETDDSVDTDEHDDGGRWPR